MTAVRGTAIKIHHRIYGTERLASGKKLCEDCPELTTSCRTKTCALRSSTFIYVKHIA